MNQLIRRFGWFALMATALASRSAAQVQPTAGSRIRDLIIEDSLTPAKTQLRDFVTQLRDSLNRVESAHARLLRARQAKMRSVVISTGRELARNCINGADAVDLTTERLARISTSAPSGDHALQSFRIALSTLSEDLRLCAHFDSLTMAAKPLDQEKLENIATAARDAIARYDVIRDGLLKLLGITLPIKGDVRRR